jgi:hypothetical protein
MTVMRQFEPIVNIMNFISLQEGVYAGGLVVLSSKQFAISIETNITAADEGLIIMV